MESRTLQDGEPSFDQVQPRGIRWYPDKPYGLWFRLPQTDCLFVRTPVVPNVTDHVPLSISLDKVRRVAYRMVDEGVASRSADERLGAGEQTAAPRAGPKG